MSGSFKGVSGEAVGSRRGLADEGLDPEDSKDPKKGFALNRGKGPYLIPCSSIRDPKRS